MLLFFSFLALTETYYCLLSRFQPVLPSFPPPDSLHTSLHHPQLSCTDYHSALNEGNLISHGRECTRWLTCLWGRFRGNGWCHVEWRMHAFTGLTSPYLCYTFMCVALLNVVWDGWRDELRCGRENETKGQLVGVGRTDKTKVLTSGLKKNLFRENDPPTASTKQYTSVQTMQWNKCKKCFQQYVQDFLKPLLVILGDETCCSLTASIQEV